MKRQRPSQDSPDPVLPAGKSLRGSKFALRGLALTVTFLLGCWYVLPFAFPLPDELTRSPKSPTLLDRKGTPIHHLTLPNFIRSQPTALADIPNDLTACTLAAEDKRFHSHGGIDLLATARAAKDWLSHGHAISGASTITQQLIKLSSPPAPRNIRTKLRESLLARRIEMSWNKEQILEAYLNRLDYGNNRRGPREAARFFFQKPLNDLSLGECALLSGLPQAPSRLNPLRHPERALARREIVLKRLASTGNYENNRISSATGETLDLHPMERELLAPWLPQFSATSTNAPPADIHTNLDLNLQRDVEAIVREELATMQDFNVQHAAVVVIHNPSGEILSLVSSGDWHDPRGGQINGALSPRSPGSALKPFTYLLAFEKGARFPGSIVPDIPTRFRTEEGLDAPANYDRQFRGPVTIRTALACSLNIPAMRELNSLGGPTPLHKLLSELGMSTLDDDPLRYGLGLTLGNNPVRLLELTNAFATLARGGIHLPPRLFKSDSETASSASKPRLFTAESAYLIADILSDPAARAPAFGRHGSLELPFRCAAKTGTSSDFRDNWCLGFTPELTVGVWVGNFDNTPMKGVSGVDGAGPIFSSTMQRAIADQPTPSHWPPVPPSLTRVQIDPRSGKSLNQLLSNQVTHTQSELCPISSPPLPAAATDYDSSGRYLLDDTYTEWLGSDYNQRGDELALAPDHPSQDSLRILAPRPDSTYFLDPELPNGGFLHLATNLPGLADWHCDTLTLTPGEPEPTLILAPGVHQLTATDPRTGQSTTLSLKVESR